MATKVKQQKLRDALQRQLHDGESVEAEVFGVVDGGLVDTDIILALTNRRVLALGRGTLKNVMYSWNHDQIVSVGSGQSGLRFPRLTFTVPGDTFVCKVPSGSGAFRKLVEQRINDRQDRSSERTPQATPAATTNDVTDPSARLERLEGLRSKGLVNEDEYAAKRAAIIDDL